MTRRVLSVEFVARRRFKPAFTLSGFNILELLATLALLGMLGGLGVSNLQRDQPQVGGSVQVLTADLLWARSEAIRLHSPIRVTFSATSNSYRVVYETLEGGRTPQLAFERDLNRDFPLARLVNPDHAATQSLLFDARGVPQGLRSAARIEVASSLDATFKKCIVIEPKGLLTYKETCA